ncbi:MAG: c-type cytochrome domain-containing protein [Verrucomicrobiota bacterium]
MNLFRKWRGRGASALTFTGLFLSAQLAAGAQVDFRRDIEPIFVKRCSECHGPDLQKGKLRLDSKAEALKGAGRAIPCGCQERATRAS